MRHALAETSRRHASALPESVNAERANGDLALVADPAVHHAANKAPVLVAHRASALPEQVGPPHPLRAPRPGKFDSPSNKL